MRVLHVVATGMRRGAEVFASDLVRAARDAQVDQWVAVVNGTTMELDFTAPITMLHGATAEQSRPPLSPTGVWRLHALVDRWRPDLVQAHGGEALKHVAAALVGTDTRVVYRRIGLVPRGLLGGPRRAAYGWLMRRAARVVTVADAVRHETVRLFRLPGDSVVTIPNGVDRLRIAATRGRDETRDGLGIPPGARVLASVGAITWEKDPLAHLRVAARVLGRTEGVHVWVGDGPMRARLQAAGTELGLDDRLMLLGNRADVGDLLEAADVLLFASRADGMEGMPASVIEAGMAGLPVAGYAVAGVPEVVVDGQTGFLVRAGDEAALADRVLRLLEDADGRRAMGAAARERCLARFEIGAIAPRYLSLYREVVAS